MTKKMNSKLSSYRIAQQKGALRGLYRCQWQDDFCFNFSQKRHERTKRHQFTYENRDLIDAASRLLKK